MSGSSSQFTCNRRILAAAAAMVLAAGTASAQQRAGAVNRGEPDASLAEDASKDHFDANIVISPDGQRYAEIRTVQNQPALVFYSVEDASVAPRAYLIGDIDVSAVLWADDETLILRGEGQEIQQETVAGLQTVQLERWLTFSRKSEKFDVIDVAPQGGRQYTYFFEGSGKLMATTPNSVGDAIFAAPEIKIIRVEASRFTGGSDEVVYSAFKADLERTRKTRLERGSGDTIDWVANANGDIVARIDFDQPRAVDKVFVKRDGQGRFDLKLELPRAADGRRRDRIVGVDPATGALQAWIGKSDGGFDLVGVDQNSGAVSGSLVTDADLVPIGWSFDPAKAAVTAVIHRAGGMIAHYYLDEDLRALQGSLERALGGAPVIITSTSKDGVRAIARVLRSEGGDEFYLYDAASKRLELVSRK
ncbi:MAG: hypothetical protein GC152_11095 [Alphaproteobacteria bacterium]|nr:hypothetical protein [Alphaproteobacteria bacterium]